MARLGNRAIVERYVEAMNANDWNAVGDLQHPDFVEEWPQSGERIRGRDNYRAIYENYPGGLVKGGISTRRVVGSEDRWVTSPSFTLLRIEGTGDIYTFEGTAKYPSGDSAHWVAIAKLVDGRIAHVTSYWAPPFDAPEWRARWVERS
jgi:ketosteroid isomerase-like protein